MRQHRANAQPRKIFSARTELCISAFRGHFNIDAFYQFTKAGIKTIAWLWQGYFYLAQDAPGVATKYQNAITHQYRFFNVVGNQQYTLDRHLAFTPQIQKIRA